MLFTLIVVLRFLRPLLLSLSSSAGSLSSQPSPAPSSSSPSFSLPSFRLWDFVPPSLWPRWRDSCRASFLSYCRASATSPSASSDALAIILCLPGRFLIRDRGGKRGFQALRSRLSRTSSLPVSSSSPPPVSAAGRSASSADASRIARAKALLERGHISRATRCLFQRGLAFYCGVVTEAASSV